MSKNLYLYTYYNILCTGTNLSKTGEYCMQLLTMPLFRESKQDGLFAIVDGGKAPDGAIMIRKALPSVLENELSVYEGATEKGDPKSLEYLEHTFLTLHRYGAGSILSVELAHHY